MAIKERIDIERLLEWAYRAQCVDRQMAAFKPRGPSASPSASLGQYAELGTRVDTSSFAARAAGLRTPDDAIIIHDTVLALGEMWIEWVADDDIRIWDRDRAAREGQIIERRAGVWYREAVYVPGGVVSQPVRLEQAGTAALVIIHAKSGLRPEVHAEWRACRGQVAKDDGEADRWGRKRKRREGASLEDVMHARALYLVWRAALETLVIELAGALAGYEVTGPDAPEEPWTARR